MKNLYCPEKGDLAEYRIYIYDIDKETRLNSKCVSYPICKKDEKDSPSKEELLEFIKEKINSED